MSWHEVLLGLKLNQVGLLAAITVALTCAYLGVYVVLKRIVFVGMGLAQVSAAGIALAFLAGPWLAGQAHRYVHAGTPLRHVGFCFEWLAVRPVLVSFVLTLGGVWLFARHSRSRTLPRDSIIGAGYVAAYALTLLFILRSAKGMDDVRELLDGSVLASTGADVALMACVFGGVLALHAAFYKQLLFVAFDPEAAEARGYRVGRWELLFYVTLGLTITVAIRHAGMLSVFSYLVLPAMTGLTAARRMGSAILVALASALASAVGGFVLALKWDLPLSPPSIAVGLGLLLAVSVFRRSA